MNWRRIFSRARPTQIGPQSTSPSGTRPGPATVGSGTAYQRPFVPNFPQAPPQGRLPGHLLQPPASRPSYDLAGLGPFLGPYWHVPLAADLALFRKLRETVPVIDIAIIWLSHLIGEPEVECEDEDLKAEVNTWLRELSVNRIQTGWSNWLHTYKGDMLTYGRAHAEMVLTNARDDIYSILELHPATTALRPQPDGYSLDVVQYQSMGGVPVLMNPDLLLSSVNDIRSDDPNGTSLLFGLPFVTEIFAGMLRALGQTWGRFGSPSYHVNWVTPKDWNDPTGEQTQNILGRMQGNFQTAMQDRASGTLRDFFTSGDVQVQVIGAAGAELDFSVPSRVLMEQIVSKTGLPPFIFGLQWATTERMSTSQAILLAKNVESYRNQIAPGLYRLIELRQALVGRPVNLAGRMSGLRSAAANKLVKLSWGKMSLQDRMEEARADWMDAQAQEIELGVWERRVTLGVNSMPDLARNFRDDLTDFDDEEVKAKLPKLLDEPPQPVMAPAGGGQGGPPRGPAGPTGEGQNSFWFDEGFRQGMTAGAAMKRELAANGNGKH